MQILHGLRHLDESRRELLPMLQGSTADKASHAQGKRAPQADNEAQSFSAAA